MLCKGPHLSCVVRQVATTFGSSVEAMMAFPDGPLGTPVAPPAPEPTEGKGTGKGRNKGGKPRGKPNPEQPEKPKK